MSLASGHTATQLVGQEWDKQQRDWKGYTEGLVRLSPGRWLFPTAYLKFANKLYDFKWKSSDVVVMTYPKCGTTWAQEIIWTMRNNPDLNHPMAMVPVLGRSPFVEMDTLMTEEMIKEMEDDPTLAAFKMMCPDQDPRDGVMLQLAQAIPDPRTIKTHLPFSLLTPSLLDHCKVVYVARNTKDVITSYHHHCRLIKIHGYVGSFQDFVQYFVDDDLVYGPYWLHLKEAWEKRHHPNLHFMFYEDMKADIMKELGRLNTFLGTQLSQDQLHNVAHYTSFKEMKARDTATGTKPEETSFFVAEVAKKDGGFFRKGEAGDWKGKLTPELEAKVNKWTEDHLGGLGINFK